MNRIINVVVATSLLVAGAARAEKDPLQSLVEQAATAMAPDAGRLGDFFPGQGKRTQWQVLMEQGKCYVISAAAGGGAKKMFLYLWGPDGQRITDNRAGSMVAALTHCATVTGMHKFEGKTASDGPWVAGVYLRGAPKQAVHDKPAPPPPPPAAAAASGASCNDDGERGSGNLVVSCDGKAIDVYFDGQFLQHAPGQMPLRVDGAGAGCHRVKVDCWTGVFKHGVVYDGPVKVYGDHEARYNGRPGALDLVGKSPLAPPPPAVSHEGLRDAMEYLHDAIDYNHDTYSNCQSRVGGKLEAIKDLLHDLRDGRTSLDRVLGKLDDTRALVREDCPPRIGESIARKLERVRGALGATSSRSRARDEERVAAAPPPQQRAVNGTTRAANVFGQIGAVAGSVSVSSTSSSTTTHSSSSSSSSSNGPSSRYRGSDGCDGDWQLGENAMVNSRNQPGVECNNYNAPTNCPTGLYIQMRSQRKCYCIARCSDYNSNPGEGQACTQDGSFVCDHYGSLSTTNHAVFCAPTAWNLCRK